MNYTVDRLLPVLLALLGTVANLPAQESESPHQPDQPRRVFTMLVGFGNDMGWLGTQAELHLLNEHMSVFGGVGYLPAEPTGIAFAGGARGYAGGKRHRGFLELNYSLVGTVSGRFSSPLASGTFGSTYYGPGAMLGYQFTALSGFTLLGSAGIGYAPGLNDTRFNPIQFLANIGFGYTWR